MHTPEEGEHVVDERPGDLVCCVLIEWPPDIAVAEELPDARSHSAFRLLK